MTDEDKIRHDFKNQLAVIRGFSEILLADTQPGDAHRADLEEIHKAAVAALALLDRIFAPPEDLTSLGRG
jgi:signal transduction histidine kinase